MQKENNKAEDIVSICIVSIITLLLFLITVTGSL